VSDMSLEKWAIIGMVMLSGALIVCYIQKLRHSVFTEPKPCLLCRAFDFVFSGFKKEPRRD